MCRLFLVAVSRDYSLAVVLGLLIVVASLAEHGSRCRGSVVAAYGLQSSGSVVVVSRGYSSLQCVDLLQWVL